jgi:CBS domain-containing protein
MITETALGLITVGEIMTSKVVTIEMDDSLEVIRDIFRKVKFHHLIVVDGEKIVGLFSRCRSLRMTQGIAVELFDVNDSS